MANKILIKTQMARIAKMTPEEHIAALDEVLNWILNNPHTWNQSTWVCNTGMCVAGSAGYFSPFKFNYRMDVWDPGMVFHLKDYKGNQIHISEYAHALFGLEGNWQVNFQSHPGGGYNLNKYSESFILFNAGNSMLDLFRARNYIAARRGLYARKIPHKQIQAAEEIATATNYARELWSDAIGDDLDDFVAPENWKTSKAKEYPAIPPGYKIRQARAFWEEIARQRAIRKKAKKNGYA